MYKRALSLLLAALTLLSLCASALAAEPATEPELTATTEPIPEPEITATEEPASEPEPTATEEPVAEPEVTATTEPVTEPEITATAEPVAEPEVTATAEPASEPEPTQEPAEDAAPAAAAQVEYRQSMARALLDMVNDLRTSYPPPELAGVNSGYEAVAGLSALTYDAALEQQAMQEIVNYAATGYDYAPTTQFMFVRGPITAQAAFALLAEEGGTYKGQTHRRVLLDTSIRSTGIACCNYSGTYCWMIKFSSDGGTAPETAPRDDGDGTVATGEGWTLDDTGTLTITSDSAMAVCGITIGERIPDTNPGDDVDDSHVEEQVNTPWAQYASDITGAAIGEGVTYIGSYAFSGCWNLTDVSLPSSLTEIGDNAFNWCERLQFIELPAGLTAIGACAFASCTGLASVMVPEGVTVIGSAAFTGCENAKSVVLPRSVTDIGPGAFMMCGGDDTVFTVVEQTYSDKYFASDPPVGKLDVIHDWGEPVTQDPTCTNDGSKTVTCLIHSDVTETEVIPALGHTWNDGQVVRQPTCEKTGVRTCTCTVCGIAKDETIPLLDHTWDSGMITTEPTYTAEGVRTFTCTVCGLTRTEPVERLLPTPTPAPTAEPLSGWQMENGIWYWYEGGAPVRNAFVDQGRYYVDGSGVMLTGWQYIGGSWYWFNGSGAMQTGWEFIGGRWYYLTPGSGAMKTGWYTVDGVWYWSDGSGAMATGWLNDRGTWYYLNGSGAMLTGWQYIGGVWYYLTPGSGAMKTGWYMVDGKWYWSDGSGAMKTGWLNDRGTWYYLSGSGAMLTGWQYIGGAWYYLTPGSGAMKTGWLNDRGTWYYLNGSGAMLTSTWVGSYYVNADGVWIP